MLVNTRTILLSSILCGLTLASHGTREQLIADTVSARPATVRRSQIATDSKSAKTFVEPQFFPKYGSRRVEIAYGPYMVNAMDASGGMFESVEMNIEMPCTDCTITYISASLEYPNGTVANTDTNLWLHHMILINLANPDPVCGSNYYGRGERWFTCGNERMPADLTKNGTIPTGYYLSSNSSSLLSVELMNQGMQQQETVVTITYEYIPGSPRGFYDSVPLWLDIGGCSGSNEPAKSYSTFEYTAPYYTAEISGAVTAIGGHVNDGGTHLEVISNNNDVCNCVAAYGETPAYWDAPGTSMVMPMDPNFGTMAHISSISGCSAPTSMVVPGDAWTVRAYYNFTEYFPMLDSDGSLSDIMGVAVVYVAKNMTQEDVIRFAGTQVAPIELTPEPTAVAVMDMSLPDSFSANGLQSAATCVRLRDSPGNISTLNLNMNNPNLQGQYLAALMNDTCLQVWSNAYARAFWYGIIIVIAVSAFVRFFHLIKLAIRRRDAAAKRYISPGTFSNFASFLVRAVRRISYAQIAPTKLRQVVSLPGFGILLLSLTYFGFLMGLSFLDVSTGDDQTYQNIGVRAGWLSVAQVPLLVLLAGKRNLISLLTAVSYERLNILHRRVARGLLLTATYHFGFQAYAWTRGGVFQLEWTTDSCIPTGLATYAFVLWMNISTLRPFRKLSYEFFVMQHIITFIGFIVAVMYHLPSTAYYSRVYIYVAIGLYFVSRFAQTLLYAYRNIMPSKATIRQVSDDVTMIKIKHRNLSSWRPGSFVLLSIPRYGILQSHPASIASTPASNDGELVFFLRKHKGFTKRIHRTSSQQREHIAFIDGPYGGGQSDFASFQTVVLISGSTGISFTLPILHDIAARAVQGRIPVQELCFIVAMKDLALLTAVKQSLLAALGSLRASGINASVRVHITGAFEPHHFFEQEKPDTPNFQPLHIYSSYASEKKEYTQTMSTPQRTNSGNSTTSESGSSGLLIAGGRPDLKSLLTTAKRKSKSEMGVAVCGPASLASDVRNLVAGMQFTEGSNEQGVYLHVEGFSW